MSLETPERRPKEHIVDTRDRFMDYIGNAINTVLGDYDNLSEESFSEEAKVKIRDRIKTSTWPRFFQSVEIFLESDFEPAGKITRENIENILKHRDEDPLADGVIDNVDRLYRSSVGLED